MAKYYGMFEEMTLEFPELKIEDEPSKYGTPYT